MRRWPSLLLVVSLGLTGCSDGAEPDRPAAAPTPSVSPSPSPSASPSPAPLPSPSPTGPVEAQEPPPVAGSPADLAANLTEAEQTIRSESSSEAAVADAGHVQQAAYRALVARPEWRRQVVAAMPPDLRPTVEAHVEALAALRRLARPQPRLPSWLIVAPPPAEELLGHYRAAEQEFGVGWEYLAAIHLVETRMGRIRGTSTAGARGPMQFMPGTWDIYGEGDIEDTRDAIRAAARYLKASGAPARMSKALFAYNRSDAYVRGIEMHAEQMRSDPRTFRGYYHWQVYYRTTAGDRVLPVGYDGRVSR